MKWIFSVLGVVSIGIVILLFFLMKRGVIVRPQPLIKPTAIASDFSPVGKHLFLRLFPVFQPVEIVIWRLGLPEAEKQKLLQDVKTEFSQQLKKTIQVIEGLSLEEALKVCEFPCWILVAANTPNEDISKKMNPTSNRWIQIRSFEFQNIESVPNNCDTQKILSEECLFYVALNLAKKKIEKIKKRVFFLYQYLDRDYYLFIQTTT